METHASSRLSGTWATFFGNWGYGEALFLDTNFRDMTFETPKSSAKSTITQLSDLAPSHHMKLFLIRHCKRSTWATAGTTPQVVCQRAPSRRLFMIPHCFILQAVRRGLHLRRRCIRSINITSDCLPMKSWHYTSGVQEVIHRDAIRLSHHRDCTCTSTSGGRYIRSSHYQVLQSSNQFLGYIESNSISRRCHHESRQSVPRSQNRNF